MSDMPKRSKKSLKSYGRQQFKGSFKSKSARKLFPSSPGISQTRRKGFKITVRYRAGEHTLTEKQFMDFYGKNIYKSFFYIGGIYRITNYFRGQVTYVIYKDKYDLYGSLLFETPDDDGNYPVTIGGKEYLVSAKVTKKEPIYMYKPYSKWVL